MDCNAGFCSLGHGIQKQLDSETVRERIMDGIAQKLWQDPDVRSRLQPVVDRIRTLKQRQQRREKSNNMNIKNIHTITPNKSCSTTSSICAGGMPAQQVRNAESAEKLKGIRESIRTTTTAHCEQDDAISNTTASSGEAADTEEEVASTNDEQEVSSQQQQEEEAGVQYEDDMCKNNNANIDTDEVYVHLHISSNGSLEVTF